MTQISCNIDIFSAMEELGFWKVKEDDLYQALGLMSYRVIDATIQIAAAHKAGIIWINANNEYNIDLRNQGWAPGGYFFKCSDCGNAWHEEAKGPVSLGDKYSTRCKVHALEALEDSLRHEFRFGPPAQEIEDTLLSFVEFVANDYHELSFEKAAWQRDDWKARAKRVLEAYYNAEKENKIELHQAIERSKIHLEDDF